MSKYSFSIKSNVNLGKKGYFPLYAETDTPIESFCDLIDGAMVAYAKSQASKAVRIPVLQAIKATEYKDRKPIVMTFCDSDHPEKKFRMNIPAAKSDLTAIQKETLAASIAALGLKFVLREKSGNDWVDNSYNLNSVVTGGMGQVIDVFAVDTASTQQTVV